MRLYSPDQNWCHFWCEFFMKDAVSDRESQSPFTLCTFQLILEHIFRQENNCHLLQAGFCLPYSSILKMEVICSSEMSVDSGPSGRTTRSYIPEDRTLPLVRLLCHTHHVQSLSVLHWKRILFYPVIAKENQCQLVIKLNLCNLNFENLLIFLICLCIHPTCFLKLLPVLQKLTSNHCRSVIFR
jgi:hypothetical protein